jgi:hypothetical protein
MKRIFAAITAVTLAAGLSLAAVAGPATAETTPTATPTPAATTTVAPTPTTTSAPVETPTSTPTTTPAPAPTAATAGSTAGTTPLIFAAASSTQTFTADSAASTSYVTVVWSMPSWNGSQSATWDQTFVSQTAETHETLDVAVPTTCGTQYQIDSYVVTAKLTAFLAAAKNGTKLTNGADNSYLASGGWNNAYKLVQNAACPPPCIADSQVSYTYSSTTNSGIITVPTVRGSSGALCQPFYVTATSWKYTSTNVWPQVIDKVQHVNGTPVGGNNIAIQNSGTYAYSAPVTCGQGDIYASFTANDSTLFPENDALPGAGYLDGPGDPLHEHFLHDMGFINTDHVGATYVQTGTSCWSPTTHSGTATGTVPTCVAGSVSGTNTLTLDAVAGGKWTVTAAGYSQAYAIGFGGSATPALVQYETYTISLSDGDVHDGITITPYSTTWTPVLASALECRTIATPVSPTVVDITQCGVGGSITIPTTTGVVYSVDGTVRTSGTTISGLSGTHTVSALAASGYYFVGGATQESLPSVDLGSVKTCDVTVVTETCTADGPVSSIPVALDLDNTSSSVASTFEVTIDGTSYDHTFTADAGTKPRVSIGSSGIAGETIKVYINNATMPVTLTVGSFAGCVLVTPGDPSHTDQVCTASNAGSAAVTVGGTVSTDGNPNIQYTLTGPAGFTPVIIPSLPNTPTVTGLAPGDYTVTAVAASGFKLSGNDTFPFTIAAPVDCDGIVVTPVVTSVQPTCVPDQTTDSAFTAADTLVEGSITIPTATNATYTINGVAISSGTHIEPNGSYVVVATLTPGAIASGYTFGTSSAYTLNAASTVATFSEIDFTAACLPTEATWHAGATSTNAVCTSKGDFGVITVEHVAGEEGHVSYTVVNDVTHAAVVLGTTTATLSVVPGHYTVTGAPVPSTDGISGDDNTFHLTVLAAATLCGDPTSLAFTGGTIAWLGFVLAGGMLFLGAAFLLMRRRANRIAE